MKINPNEILLSNKNEQNTNIYNNTEVEQKKSNTKDNTYIWFIWISRKGNLRVTERRPVVA